MHIIPKCPAYSIITMRHKPNVSFRRGGIHQSHTDRIVLNVGGRRFETTQSTLRNISDTRLSDLDESSIYYDQNQKEYFFDRNPEIFDSVLNYFRTGQLHFPHCHCGPAVKLELEYWGVDENSISPCCWSSFKHYDNEKRYAFPWSSTLQMNNKNSSWKLGYSLPPIKVEISNNCHFKLQITLLWSLLCSQISASCS